MCYHIDMTSEVSITEWKNNSQALIDFYAACGYRYTPSDTETILVACVDGIIVGAVRLCIEEGHLVLRGMQVSSDMQGKGVGTKLLYEFSKRVGERECFCIPYTHLEHFYAQIGFEILLEKDAPLFLQERMKEYRNKKNGKTYMLMRRPVGWKE